MQENQEYKADQCGSSWRRNGKQNKKYLQILKYVQYQDGECQPSHNCGIPWARRKEWGEVKADQRTKSSQRWLWNGI